MFKRSAKNMSPALPHQLPQPQRCLQRRRHKLFVVTRRGRLTAFAARYSQAVWSPFTMSSNPQVLISEVGPRDGLQSVKATMPTPAKLSWIDALYASGIREIEVASFVPA
jgi:hypothetical protein